MKIASIIQKLARRLSVWVYPIGFLTIYAAFFLIELAGFWLLKPEGLTSLAFGALWSLLLTCFIFCLPRLVGRITFGLLYFLMLLWTLAQSGYYLYFGKMMWLSTLAYAGESAIFIGDALACFPLLWWLALILLLLLGVAVVRFFPRTPKSILWRIPCVLGIAIAIISISMVPEYIFKRDKDIWGTKSEYAQSSSYRAAYNTMFDTKRVYDMTGMYQLVMRDIWVNELYPHTPAYQKALKQQTATINEYFAQRGEATDNDMTGIFSGKNVIMVLMESMTRRFCRLMCWTTSIKHRKSKSYKDTFFFRRILERK